ncbi:lipase [Pseudomonas sp. SWI6]|uniref:lipase family protein n=1 Tax=Pseudomonas sp. SWI6 TaxID=2083051 RepID=UPI000CE5F4CD|nr:lipase family protein [Pseudomonas sp. SWI6]AVD83615.1 lipase [Pseudomonas sp. SWI6]
MELKTDVAERISASLNDQALTCPHRGRETTFQLVDEQGAGEPYAGLYYEAVDSEGVTYSGALDVKGCGRVTNHHGAISLRFESEYVGSEELYSDLQRRKSYPLKITDLQVRAEKTQYANADGSRTSSNPAQAAADHYYQVETSELVRYACHLPPLVDRGFPPRTSLNAIMGEHGNSGICLMPDACTVLEVRPLRALRPLLSANAEFCALNLYQLALMATLSYNPFGQDPDEHPVLASTVSFPFIPTSGNWFGSALNTFNEIWRVDPEQSEPMYPILEEVAYSRRLEIVPFDPALYPVNDPSLGNDQQNPARLHFLDDRGVSDATDTQAFITHTSEYALIAIRGTNEAADFLRDVDALQVPFEQGEGRVHRGFYESALKVFDFAMSYLDQFDYSKKLIICGHSLGGAVALILAEMLRRSPSKFTIQLYTYGAPRAGDVTFTRNAADLIHHRIVNHDDVIPNAPLPWMNPRYDVMAQGALVMQIDAMLGMKILRTGLVNQEGEHYEHHGNLRHFMPIALTPHTSSAILWSPGCDTITDQALCSRYLRKVDGLPELRSISVADHAMTAGYLPACWAVLRRHQQALADRAPAVTRREIQLVEEALKSISEQLIRRRARLAGGDHYARTHEPSQKQVEQELSRISVTRERLATLNHTPISAADIYGEHAGTPHLMAALARWHAHAQNARTEPLAQAPIELAPVEPVTPAMTHNDILAYLDAVDDPNDPLNLI